MRLIRAFIIALVLALGYAAGQYLAGGYVVDRQLDFMSKPVVLGAPEGGQQY